MGRKFQVSFAGGELDPTLHERVDLEKYGSALATARNVVVGKSGAIISRPGRQFIASCYSNRDGNDVVSIVPLFFVRPRDGIRDKRIIEIGRCYNSLHSDYTYYIVSHKLLNEGSVVEQVTETDQPFEKLLSNFSYQGIDIGYRKILPGLPLSMAKGLQFDSFTGEFYTTDLSLNNYPYDQTSEFNPYITISSSSPSGTGYQVDYAFSYDFGYGELFYTVAVDANFKLPVTVNTKNTFNISVNHSSSFGVLAGMPWGNTSPTSLPRLRVYRRPSGSGAFGLIGEVTEYTDGSPGYRNYTIDDVGQGADYQQSLPEPLISESPAQFSSSVVHQQRLVLVKGRNIYFSRTGLTGNFTRNYPLTDDSALEVVMNADVLHVVSKAGLIFFTEDGLYYNNSVITPSTVTNFKKQGDWVSSSKLKPLVLSDSVLFFDERENVVRELIWSDTSKEISANEVSVFSDHLLNNVEITSWVYQDGETPCVYVSLSSGKGLMFTYLPEHHLRAWTRVGSTMSGIRRFIDCGQNPTTLPIAPTLPFGSEVSSLVDRTKMTKDVLVLMEDDAGNLWIEKILDRYPSFKLSSTNPEYDKGPESANMDSFVSWHHMILDDLTSGSVTTGSLTLTPLTLDEWGESLSLSSNGGSIFTSPGIGDVGTVFKWFNPVDRTEITLEVVSRSDDDYVVVQPSEEFPSEYAMNPRLYECRDVFTGLDHLEGKNVSILADGYVVASPLNDIENYPIHTVVSGSVTTDSKYAIVHIGLPIVNDVETLDVTETGQGRGLQYTRLESITCNRVWVKTKDTRGLYVGNRFPADDTVKGSDISGTNMVEMDGFDSYDVNYEDENPIVGNRYDQPVSKRVEQQLPGDWKSRGRVCMRNVDPVHFEILSITPDIEIAEG